MAVKATEDQCVTEKPIWDRIHAIGKETSAIFEELALLKTDLEPILKLEAESKSKSEDKPKPSRLFHHLQNELDRLMFLRRKISSLRKRLEI